MIITSVNNEKIKELLKLHDKKYRDKLSLFFVEGIDLVNEAYKNGYLKHLYILDGSQVLFDDIPYTYVSESVMKKISDMETYSDYFGVCDMLRDNDVGNKIIILDGVQDPGNLGTIIRSAVAFGFSDVILSPECVSLYNPKVVRSTKGMLFNINVKVCELDNFINSLEGYMIYGTDVVNGINIKDENISSKIAIVIGNEGNGISDNIKELCNKFIYIPMDSKCESLNAGVSASIIMYEVNNK